METAKEIGSENDRSDHEEGLNPSTLHAESVEGEHDEGEANQVAGNVRSGQKDKCCKSGLDQDVPQDEEPSVQLL